jgi:AraC-like DNA-binding protein
MESFGIILHTAAFWLSILVGIILLWVNKDKSHSKNLLILLLLILSLLNLNSILFQTGWYMSSPWFHKVALPFSLLPYPVAWLYIRSVLLGELKFRKYDWLLLLPALIFAINLLPYYIMPIDEKRAYLIKYYNSSLLKTSDGEGYLPPYVVSFVRFGWSLIFIILNYKIIIRFKKQASEKVLIDNDILLRWLNILNGLLAMLLAAALFVAIIAPIKKTGFNVLAFSLGTVVFVICLQLLIRPQILYGVYKPTLLVGEQDILLPAMRVSPESVISEDTGKEAINESMDSAMNISQSDAYRYKKAIENYFHVHQPFLNVDYSLEKLSTDIKIPRYVLSSFINREYGMGFREFLNRRRVEYMIANLDKPEWKSFTIEAIGTECGFISRTTFFNNFKQITGQSPSEYIKNQNKNNLPPTA